VDNAAKKTKETSKQAADTASKKLDSGSKEVAGKAEATSKKAGKQVSPLLLTFAMSFISEMQTCTGMCNNRCRWL
jgi:hypothetical protein